MHVTTARKNSTRPFSTGLAALSLAGIVATMIVAAASTAIAQDDIEIFDDRTRWRASMDTVAIETLNDEPAYPFRAPTPYTTTQGWTLTAQASAVELTFWDSGIDGTRVIHFRDFGRRVEFTFPGGQSTRAFGIDTLASSSETWELWVGGRKLTRLARGGIGFVGVLAENPVTSFVLTSPDHAQGGVSIDNLSIGSIADSCRVGNVNTTAGPATNVLLLNGQSGEEVSRGIWLPFGSPLWAAMRRPPAGGTGRFVLHANLGQPTSAAAVPLPRGIGRVCFPMLLDRGATPNGVWNGIGAPARLGISRNLAGTRVPDPRPADTVVFSEQTSTLPIGTVVTFQAVIHDPAAPNATSFGVSNAVVLFVTE